MAALWNSSTISREPAAKATCTPLWAGARGCRSRRTACPGRGSRSRRCSRRRLHQQLMPRVGQHRLVEGLAALVVGHVEADVVEHGRPTLRRILGRVAVGGSSNGKTPGFGPGNGGSIPPPPVGLQAQVRPPPRRQPVAHLQALGQPQLLELAHVGLEGLGARGPARRPGRPRGRPGARRSCARVWRGPRPARGACVDSRPGAGRSRPARRRSGRRARAGRPAGRARRAWKAIR